MAVHFTRPSARSRAESKFELVTNTVVEFDEAGCASTEKLPRFDDHIRRPDSPSKTWKFAWFVWTKTRSLLMLSSRTFSPLFESGTMLYQ